MNFVQATAAVVALALAGVGLLSLSWRTISAIPLAVRLAFGYCVGTAVVTLIFFGAYLSGIPFSRLLVLAPTLILAGIGIWSCRQWRPNRNLSREQWFGILVGSLWVLVALALSWSRPIYGYDALSMWALKAKVMFYAKTWPATLFDPYTTHHTDYPPLIPATQAYVFFWMDAFDDVASRVVFAAFYASGAAILWYWLRQWRVHLPVMWLLWWCATPVVMEQVKITYADMPLAVFLLGFFGAIVTWLREPTRHEWLGLAGIFCGLAFWVKQDALVGVGSGFMALLVVTVVRRLPAWRVLLVIMLAGLMALPWRIFVWHLNLPSDHALEMLKTGGRLWIVMSELCHYAFVDTALGYFFWVLLIGVIFCWPRLRRTATSWLAASLAVGAIVVVLVYLTSKVSLEAQLKTSADRVLLSLFVPGLLLAALLWRRGCRYGWLYVRGVVIFAVFALAGVMMIVQIREVARLQEEFGGKTLSEQHQQQLDPQVIQALIATYQAFPPGTHVRLTPKRSIRYHQFYYEAFPRLVVDDKAANSVVLE